jgi:hypothetical protein
MRNPIKTLGIGIGGREILTTNLTNGTNKAKRIPSRFVSGHRPAKKSVQPSGMSTFIVLPVNSMTKKLLPMVISVFDYFFAHPFSAIPAVDVE